MRDRQIMWLRRAGWATFGLLLAAGAVVLVTSVFGGHSTPQRHAITTITRVILPPPPPPPPPPPMKEPPPEKQTLVQAAPRIQEPKPAAHAPAKPAAKPAASAAPPGAPLTAAAGAGANAYGLGVGNGGGDTIGGGGGGGGGGDSYGWYAGVIQSQIQLALRRDDRTRGGRYRATLNVWLNAAGQVTRAEIVSFTGDAGLQAAVSQALTGLSLGEAMPQGLPLPVHMRIAAQSG